MRPLDWTNEIITSLLTNDTSALFQRHLPPFLSHGVNFISAVALRLCLFLK